VKVFGKKKKDENESPGNAPAEKKSKPAGKQKVSKGFGNTIILFIVFFIVFTVIVTGVAFFADKLDLSGNGNEKNLEDIAPAEIMTDPKEGESTEYVMDDKGNIGKKEIMEPMLEKKEETKETSDKKEPEIPKANAKVERPAPLPPVNIKPNIKKPEPKKEAAKPAPKPASKPASKSTSLTGKDTNGDYAVQIASFRSQASAESEMKKLKKMIPSVFVVRADLGEKGIWYRIRCFNGVSRSEAIDKAALIAQKTRYKPYPMKK